ncbi:hypothetical protein V3C99_015502, partial [Haemonchus contortus]
AQLDRPVHSERLRTVAVQPALLSLSVPQLAEEQPQQLEPLRLQPGQLLLLLPEPPQLPLRDALPPPPPQGPPLPLGVSLPALQRLLVGQP